MWWTQPTIYTTQQSSRVEIQQSSRGNDINIIVILIICGVVALLHHPTVGLVFVIYEMATRTASTGGSDAVVVLVRTTVDSIFAFSW